MNHVALWICSYPLILTLILKIAKIFLSRTLPSYVVAGAPSSYSSLPTPAPAPAVELPVAPVYDSATLDVAIAIASLYPRSEVSSMQGAVEPTATAVLVEALACTYVETSFPQEMKSRLARLIGLLTHHTTREQDYTLVGDLFSSCPRKARAARKSFANGYWGALKTLSPEVRCSIYRIAELINKL